MREVFAAHYYVPAPDMGTGPDEMAFIYNETLDPAAVTGKPEGTPGWQPGRREATGYGVSFVTVKLLEEQLGLRGAGARVAIQGFGNVGSYTARFLAESGVRITGVTDAYGGVGRRDGLDVEALARHVESTGTVRDFAGGDSLTNEQLFALDVDVLIPAATGHVINADNAGGIRARAVVEAANNPTTLEGMEILTTRGIEVVPDIVANAGGVIASMEEYSRSLSATKTPAPQMFATIRKLLGTALGLTLERSRTGRVTLSEAAVGLAVERVYDAMKRRRMI